MSEFNFVAPNGDEIQGTSEFVPGASTMHFTGVDRDYEHDGDTEMFWDGSETETIEGVTVFTDDSGVDWLAHHLIPADAEPVASDTQEAMELEMKLGRALADVRKAHARVMAIPLVTVFTRGGVDQLAAVYEASKAKSIALRDRDLARVSA